MRFHLRQFIIRAIHWIGLIRILRFLYRKRVVILTIHGVMDERDEPSWQPLRPRLSRDKLDEYLRVLSKRYHFVSLMDAVDMLQGRRPMRTYSLVLTFDDGYRNNLTHAVPILQRYNAPAIFFVPTGFLDKPRPFWFDRLDYALQRAQLGCREVRIGSFTTHIEGGTKEALRESFKRMRRTAKKQQMSDHDFLREMEQLAVQLEAESGWALSDVQNDDNWSAIITWEQIGKIKDDSVTIGSHTVDHVRLGLVDAEDARDQLSRSKRDIEIHTGKPCTCVAYPVGSYSEETIELAKESGYACGVTTDEGFNRMGDDVLKLRRIALPVSVGRSELLAGLCGVFGLLSRMKARLLRLRASCAFWEWL